MSIANRVADSVDAFVAGNVEQALINVSIAIDATAQRQFGGHGNTGHKYKDFLHANMDIITKVGFGVPILNLNLAYDHPDLKKEANGCCTFQSILYHVVRCGLLHAGTIPQTLIFQEERLIEANGGGKLVLPTSIVYGLLTSVVVAPTNAKEKSPRPVFLNLPCLRIPIEMAWGKKTELLWAMDVCEWNVREEEERQSQVEAKLASGDLQPKHENR